MACRPEPYARPAADASRPRAGQARPRPGGALARGALASAAVGLASAVALALTLALAPACTHRPSPDELNLFAWSEYVPQAVIDGFTAETGIRVNYESYSSNEEMLAKLVSGATRYDLVQPSEYAVEALIAERRLRPIDRSKVPNLRNLAPELLHLPHDPGQRYTVPWMAGTVGIVVNTARVPAGAVKGYGDVFQERHRGRIVVVDDPREMVSWALASLGLPINDVSEASLAKVRPVLERWLALVKVYDSDSPKTALLNGDVDLGIVWSGEAAILHAEDSKFEYVLPREGAHRFVDSLAVPADAPNPEAAFRFMDYVLRPEVSRKISDEFPYTNPNLEARKLLSAKALANPASYPPADPRLDTFRDIGAMAVRVDKLVTDLKAGL